VVIAPGRARRPHPAPAPLGADPSDTFDPTCPFCPGNEALTPDELWRLPARGDNRRLGSGWAIRVVPNRFPVFAAGNAPPRRRTVGPFNAADGIGAHEIVIETPRHDRDLPDAGDEAVAAVFGAYRARARALREIRPGLVLPFRNHGPDAGTSLTHPHSQIVAAPIVPLRYRQLFDIAREHYDDHGTSLYTDVTGAELAEGSRIVAAADHVVALTPYAASVPFETWLMPRAQQASFADAPDEELADAALLLRGVLNAIRRTIGDVSYNYVIVSAPNGEEGTAYFSWHLRLLPRTTTAAGFELGTGIAVNPVPPETAASRLREAVGSIGLA
jgi:UDPglucose--hexose-1-phosphate uridylyltransferase